MRIEKALRAGEISATLRPLLPARGRTDTGGWQFKSNLALCPGQDQVP